MPSASALTDKELDTAYTDLCTTMTRLGERWRSLFLARFALLSIVTIGDESTVRRLIEDAADLSPTDNN